MCSFCRILKYTTQLSQEKVETAISTAFQIWANASSLTFTKISQGKADIDIAFYEGGRPSALELSFTFTS